MSNAVSALQGKVNADGFAQIREMHLMGMITLRGDLEAGAVKKALKAQLSIALPAQREVVTEGETVAAWMSPDEVLIVVPYAQAQSTADALAKRLATEHALVVNVSDARAAFEVKGADARDVLAKLAPVDLSANAFGAGMVRRTRLAQAAAAFWLSGEGSFTVICFRSEAGYVFDLLAMSASAGSEVGFF